MAWSGGTATYAKRCSNSRKCIGSREERCVCEFRSGLPAVADDRAGTIVSLRQFHAGGGCGDLPFSERDADIPESGERNRNRSDLYWGRTFQPEALHLSRFTRDQPAYQGRGSRRRLHGSSFPVHGKSSHALFAWDWGTSGGHDRGG